MPLRAYGQFCGYARALEILGERWALLIVRDLCITPKRFVDLHRGLPGIPTNVLTARLKELEGGGVVQRTARPRPQGGIEYELTPYGRELEEVVFAIGRWGAKTMGDPRATEIITADSVRMALRSTFVPAAARGITISYELRLGPEITVHARIAGGTIETGSGPLAGADVVFEAGPCMRALMARELTPAAALASGAVNLVHGKRAAFDRFVDLFRIGALPSGEAAVAPLPRRRASRVAH